MNDDRIDELLRMWQILRPGCDFHDWMAKAHPLEAEAAEAYTDREQRTWFESEGFGQEPEVLSPYRMWPPEEEQEPLTQADVFELHWDWIHERQESQTDLSFRDWIACHFPERREASDAILKKDYEDILRRQAERDARRKTT